MMLLLVLTLVAVDPLVVRAGNIQLRSGLELREEQGGFAGLTGTRWKVKEDGEWEVVYFTKREGKVASGQPVRRGKLTAEEIHSLGGVLSSQRFSAIRPHLGPEPGVNPHTYALQFDGHSVVLDGVRTRIDGTIRDNVPVNGVEVGRFVEVADWVESHTRGIK